MTVHAIYFSPNGTTKTIITTIAGTLSSLLPATYCTFDFTLPGSRERRPEIQPGDMVIAGVPVYAGRVPNLLVKYIQSWEGNGATAVPVVVYGNRHYDDALIELRNLLEFNHFHTIAAGAFVGRHAFSAIIAKGRPDASDIHIAKEFATTIADRFIRYQAGPASSSHKKIPLSTVPVPGHSVQTYYQPKDAENNPIDMRKVKPFTTAACTQCGRCAEICPMGAISREHPAAVPGICIKCNACITYCPGQAKYFDDPGYNYHKADLEKKCVIRRPVELF